MSAQVAVELALQATVILASAGLACALWRRASAALRHVVWAAALLAVVSLPLVRLAPPLWRPSAAVAQAVLPVSAALRIDVVADPVPGWPLVNGLGVFYLAGVLWLLARGARDVRAAARLARDARPWLDGVRLSPEIDVPLVCGIVRPVVLLPAAAAQWDEERLAVVLAHERMHVARRDTLWQALARGVRAIWWPHPLVWYAAAELKRECERACDDGVLVTGVRPSAYAERLLEIARAASATRSYEGGLAMATMSELEGRLRSVLSAGRNRTAAGLRPALAILTFGGLLAAGVAALRMPALAQTGEIRGVVQDASGARVPKARVLVNSIPGQTRLKEMVMTNEVGEFSLPGLPDGSYDIHIEKPGFARLLFSGVKVGPGVPTPLSATLNVGAVQESMAVVAKREGVPGGVAGAVVGGVPGAVKAAGPGQLPSRISVGGNVQQTKLVAQPRPAYPPDCKREGVQGSVFLRAVIGKEGNVVNLEALNKLVDQRLVQAAIDAVKQWRYQPTLLNGRPVEVITEVDVNFTLKE